MPNITYSNGLSLGHQNIYHLKNKVPDVNVLINNQPEQIHLFGISESRIKLKDNVPDSSIKINKYRCLRRDRPIIKRDGHDGLVLYYHDDLHPYIKRREDLESESVESLWVEIRHKNSQPVLVCLVYRYPAAKTAWYTDFFRYDG